MLTIAEGDNYCKKRKKCDLSLLPLEVHLHHNCDLTPTALITLLCNDMGNDISQVIMIMRYVAISSE